MLMLKAFHIIAMVAWFAGLFYLPRLFVYHAETSDALSVQRFKIMERRLYYGIMWPAAVLTTLFGVWLLHINFDYYAHAHWMQAKLFLVLCLWGYHLTCGFFLKQFARDQAPHGALFYRIWNEVPTLLLIGIVVLVVVKPSFY